MTRLLLTLFLGAVTQAAMAGPAQRPVLDAGEPGPAPALPRLLPSAGHMKDLVADQSGRWAIGVDRDSRVHLWEVATGAHRIIESPGGPATVRAVDLAGDRLALAVHGRLHLLELPSAAPLWSRPIKGATEVLAFDGAGGQLLRGVGAAVEVRRTDDGALLTHLETNGKVATLAVSPDGAHLAVGLAGVQFEIWDLAAGRRLTTQGGRRGKLASLAFSPDGVLLAVAGLEAKVRLWDLEGGRWRPPLEAGGKVMALAFTVAGELVTRRSDGELTLWRGTPWTPRQSISAPSGPRAVLAGASVLVDRVEALELHTLEGSARLAIRPGPRSPILALALDHHGRRAFGSGDDRRLHVWDARTGRPVATSARLPTEIRDLAASPTRSEVLVQTRFDLFVLDAAARVTAQVPSLPQLLGAAWSSDGARIIGASEDARVVVADRDGEDVSRHPLPRPASAIVPGLHANSVAAAVLPADIEIFSLEGKGGRVTLGAGSERLVRLARAGPYLASLDRAGRSRVWDLEAQTAMPGVELPGASAMSFSPDGALYVAAKSGALWRWTAAAGASASPVQRPGVRLTQIDAAAGGGELLVLADTVAAGLHDLRSGEERVRLSMAPGAIQGLSLSRDGRHLVTLAAGQLRLWDATTGRLRHIFGCPKGGLGEALALAGAGGRAALGCTDGSVVLIDPRRAEVVQTLEAHVGAVSALVLSVDGSRLYSTGADAALHLWSLADGRRQTIRELGVGQALAVDDADALLVLWPGGSRVRVLDARSGAVLRDHTEPGLPRALTLTPDGDLVTITHRAVQLWGGRDGIAKGRRPMREVFTVAAAPGGRLVAGLFGLGPARLDATASRLEALCPGVGPTQVTAVGVATDGLMIVGTEAGEVVAYAADCRLLYRAVALRAGGWVTQRADGRIWRADDGRTVGLTTGGAWAPLPSPGASPSLSVRARRPIVVDAGGEAPVELVLRNPASTPAWFVGLTPEAPDGWRARGTLERSRIQPGEEVGATVWLRPDRAAEPGRAHLSIRVEAEGRAEEVVRLPLTVRASRLVARADPIEIADGFATLTLTIENRGDLAEREVEVGVAFVHQAAAAAVTPLLSVAPDPRALRLASALAPPQSVVVGPLAAGGEESVELPVPRAVLDRVQQASLEIDLAASGRRSTARLPLTRTRRGSTAWIFGILSILLSALGAGVWFQRRYRHPLVMRLSATPTALGALPWGVLPEVTRRLGRIRRLRATLDQCSIPPDRWALVARPPGEALAMALDARIEGHEAAGDLHLTRVILPTLPARIPNKTGVLVTERELGVEELTARLDALGLVGRFVILVDRTAAQRLPRLLAKSPLKLVVLDEKALTAVVLAVDPQRDLSQRIAAQARLGDISPYQTAGGLQDGRLFFGRRNEIALLVARAPKSHLVIGARQIGKSSLLKQIARLYPRRAAFVTLAGPDLDQAMRAAGLPDLETYVAEADQGAPRLLLLDEADGLVEADRAAGWPLLKRLRAVSAEGRANIVLAGFWALHRAAFLEHHSPIRNFAHPLPIGALDPKAARALVVEPMEALGLEVAEEAVEAVIAATGRRANLIARICDAVLRELPFGERRIDRASVSAAMDMLRPAGEHLVHAFSDLGGLTAAPAENVLDRMLMFAAAPSARFERRDLTARLEAAGAEVPRRALEGALERLILAFVFQRDGDALRWPVPLVRTFIELQCEGDPDEALALEARDWRRLHPEPPGEPS